MRVCLLIVFILHLDLHLLLQILLALSEVLEALAFLTIELLKENRVDLRRGEEKQVMHYQRSHLPIHHIRPSLLRHIFMHLA